MAMNARRWVARLAPGLLGLAVGCSTNTHRSSGCSPYEPPRASDVGPPAVTLSSQEFPCRTHPEAVRGSDPHLWVTIPCDGRTEPFLVSVRIDGGPAILRTVTGPDYGYQLTADAGPWEAADTLWHDVEMVLDPLNLFRETDETNNRATGRVRMIDPSLRLYPDLCIFRLTDLAGQGAGMQVEQVSAGTPVNVWLTLEVNGKYQDLEMSVRCDPSLAAETTRSFLDCSSPNGGNQWYTRWTPPGPGAYDVEFRVTPAPGAIDHDPSDNVFVRRLTVTP